MFTRLTLLLMLGACASASSEGPAVTTQTPTTVAPQERIDLTHENVISIVGYATSKEKVWQAMLKAHEALGSRPTELDQKTGVAKFRMESRTGTLMGKPTSNYIDCGIGSAGPRVSTYRVTVKITEAVESEYVDRTRLSTIVDATGQSPGMNSDPVQCTSLGTLEKRVAALVAAHLE